MDLARFEVLETRIKSLAESFEQAQVENRQLRQQIGHLQQTIATQQQTLATQQQTLEQVQRERDDLSQLGETLNILRQEREVIQQKLRQMLATIEWIEEHTTLSGEARPG